LFAKTNYFCRLLRPLWESLYDLRYCLISFQKATKKQNFEIKGEQTLIDKTFGLGAGCPDWAKFRLLGDWFLRADFWKSYK
jgi:hypothetical protein